MQHRYPFTINLLRRVIDTAPVFFPEKRLRRMEATFDQLTYDPMAHLRDIERAIVTFGREIWPYRKAFWSMHDTVGRGREKKYVVEELQEKRVREKYKKFFTRGGHYEDVRKGRRFFEKFFTPVEKRKIITARLRAHTRVVDEIHDLCTGKKKRICATFIERYAKEQKAIDAVIANLRALAKGAKTQWREEIFDQARVFAAGWSGMEREITATDVAVAIEYYTSMVKHYNRFFNP